MTPHPEGSDGPEGGGAAPAALELDGVSAAYGPYRALFDVSFEVPAGAVVALLGPNGAGKSTVARVASGLLATTGGRLRVGGHDVTGAPAWRIARAGLAHVPEGRGVFANLTVEENLVLAFGRRGGRREVAGALARTYERFDVLGDRRRQRAGTLSGGQQRLLSLAKVMGVPPGVLVADELSLGLAPGPLDAVYRAIEDLHRSGTALLVVEQQVERVLAVATHAVVLEHGAVAYNGPPAGALDAFEHVLAARGQRSALLAGGHEVPGTGGGPGAPGTADLPARDGGGTHHRLGRVNRRSGRSGA